MEKLIQGENDLLTREPELAAQWHPTRNNDLTPRDVPFGGVRRVWWICSQGHDWQASICNRTVWRVQCPICTNQKLIARDLATRNPGLAAEWHPTRNGDLTPLDVSLRSNKRVWWLGSCGHEWQTAVKNRSNVKTGCPICAKRCRKKKEV